MWWQRQQRYGRHWAPPDRIPDQDQVLHPGDRRSADILREVLEEPTQVVPVLRPLMTPGQTARSGGRCTWCWQGHHDECDGSCGCPHHRGEPCR